MSLTKGQDSYKPFRYPWAYDVWLLHERSHWLMDEVPMGQDIADWRNKLTKPEINLLSQIFRLFTQMDREVSDNYMDRLMPIFKPTEVKMMLGSFSAREAVHIAAYSHLLDSIGMPEVEYSAFTKYSQMKAKGDFLKTFSVDTPEEIALTMAVFGAFVEGMQLFASFAMLLNFPRFNKMKGMGQIITWSVRDETIHCNAMVQLYHQWMKEHTGIDRVKHSAAVRAAAMTMVNHEDAFIDLAFELGEVEGLNAADMKTYIRYIADMRLRQLKLQPLYGITANPLPWLDQQLSQVEFVNFFEQRATEYTKAATRGTWEDVFKKEFGEKK